MRKLNENLHIFYLQKRIVSAETIRRNTVDIEKLLAYLFQSWAESEIGKLESASPDVSTTPLRHWGFRQCLPFSWTTLKDKHCRHPIAVMGNVDTFRPINQNLLNN